MKLRVSLRAPGARQASNIQVTADATATVHDVAEALAGALGHDDTPANLTLRVNDQLTGHSHVVQAQALATKDRSLSMTPFGSPVVPPV